MSENIFNCKGCNAVMLPKIGRGRPQQFCDACRERKKKESLRKMLEKLTQKDAA